MEFRITTTGTQSPVVFNDIGGRSFTHPTVAYNLASEFSLDEISRSSDVQSALSGGHITATNEFGQAITSAATVSGETNTASNVGTGGVGVFKQKTGVDLEFKKINAGSAKVTVSDDVPNNEVDVDLGSVSINDLSDVDTVSTAPTSSSLFRWNGSNWVPFNHDLQIASASATTSTTSATPVDMPGMTLTTSSPGVSQRYTVSFTAMVVRAHGSGGEVNVQLSVGGVVDAATVRTVTTTSGSRRTAAINFVTSPVASGTVIKIQWSVSSQTAEVLQRTLSILGLP